MMLVIVPMLPALANKVTPTKVHIPTALSHLFTINWLYGFVASCVLYYVLNLVFPDRRTLITSVVHGDIEVVEGIASSNESTDGGIGHAEKGLKLGESSEDVENGAREVEKNASTLLGSGTESIYLLT